MCCPVCRALGGHLFDAAICTHVDSEDVPIQLHRDAAHGHFNSPRTFVFRLKPEMLCGDTVPYSQLTLCAKWTYNVHNDRTLE